MFRDRYDAGRRLGEKLISYKNEQPIVLAVPRGGVEVGYEVAKMLEAPLDVLVARKLGAPGQPELAMGAVIDGDSPSTVLNREVMDYFGVTQEFLDEAVHRELEEIRRRQQAYRGGRPGYSLQGRTVILVDDGIATGASIRAALRALRKAGVGRLILAVPVAPPETLERLRGEADEIIALEAPDYFGAVGLFYGNFDQTEDETVIDLLDRARSWAPAPNGAEQHKS